MTTLIAQRDSFCIDTDPTRLQLDVIHTFLSERSYWAKGRTMEAVRSSIEHSLNFGVYDGSQQVGFARVITDYTTGGWICDVFILETHRGLGLGKWLVQCMVDYLDHLGLDKVILSTWDAHSLYEKYGGFTPLDPPQNTLQRLKPLKKLYG